MPDVLKSLGAPKAMRAIFTAEITELLPRLGHRASMFLAAKPAYKILSYALG